MSWGRRTTTLAVLAIVAPLAACGDAGAPQAAPTPVRIPGATGTVPTEATAPPPALEQSVTTAGDLLTRVGTAMGEHDSVRITVTSAGASQEGDYLYLAGDDYVVRDLDGTSPVAEYRKVEGTLYYQVAGSDTWQRYKASRTPAELAPLLGEAAAYGLLTDLRNQFDAATDFAFDPTVTSVDGTPVETYTFTFDLADIAQSEGSGLGGGPVEASYSIDGSGLPVSADLVLADATSIEEDFSGWGDPLTIEAPTVG